MGKDKYDFLTRKKGGRERVTTREFNEDERVIADRESSTESRGFLPTMPMGTIGMSLTVGMATKFMREKIEVSVWETRPVTMDPGDREQVKREISADLTKEAGERLDGAVKEFFPRMLENMEED